jgi:hypothetical protein
MAAGITSVALREIDPPLAARLLERAKHSVEKQLIPAQEADGFWHYGLNGNDPKGKDVFGYFMLTGCELIQWQGLAGLPRDSALTAALRKAGDFAEKTIVPITGANGTARSPRASAGTPERYDLSEDIKRGYQLALLLLGTEHYATGARIARAALQHFPVGDGGQEGAQAAMYSALMCVVLKNAAAPRQ